MKTKYIKGIIIMAVAILGANITTLAEDTYKNGICDLEQWIADATFRYWNIQRAG